MFRQVQNVLNTLSLKCKKKACSEIGNYTQKPTNSCDGPPFIEFKYQIFTTINTKIFQKRKYLQNEIEFHCLVNKNRFMHLTANFIKIVKIDEKSFLPLESYN